MIARIQPSVVASGVLGVIGMLAVGCGLHSPTSDAYSATATLDEPPFALSMKVRNGEKITEVWIIQAPSQGPACTVANAQLRAGDETLLEFQGVSNDCNFENRAPGNGNHGSYPSIDDARAGGSANGRHLESVHVDTPIGPAEVFLQSYYECTNSCQTYTEPVAIIALTQPTGARYPSITVYSNKGRLTEDQLTDRIRQIDRLR